MNLTEFFFANYAGGYRFPTEKERELTQKAIEHIEQTMYHVKDKAAQDMLQDLFQRKGNQGFISIKTIPYEIFECRDTIVHKDVFYYHPALQMMPKKPVFDETTMTVVSEPERYLEIRRLFTADHLLSYIYTKTQTNIGLCDKNRDLGALKYLSAKYDNIKTDCSNVTFLDFILFLTDIAATKHEKVSSSLFPLFDNADSAIAAIQQVVSCAKLYGCNHETFRDESVYRRYGQ